MQPSARDYDGVDVSWIAQDSAGAVAIFITAGAGPIPEAAISTLAVAEDLALGLSYRGDAQLRASVPNPRDFVELARRGFYVYDWPHPGIDRALSGDYSLVAAPSNPLGASDVGPDVAACLVSMPAARFGDDDLTVVV